MQKKIGLVFLSLAVFFMTACSNVSKSTTFVFQVPGAGERAVSIWENYSIKIENDKSGETILLSGSGGGKVFADVEGDQIYNIYMTLVGDEKNESTGEMDKVYYDGCKYSVYAKSGKENAVDISLYRTPEYFIDAELNVLAVNYEGDDIYINDQPDTNNLYATYSWKKAGKEGEKTIKLNPTWFEISPLPKNAVGEVPLTCTFKKTNQKVTGSIFVGAKLSDIAEIIPNFEKKQKKQIAQYTGQDTIKFDVNVKISEINAYEVREEDGSQIFDRNTLSVDTNLCEFIYDETKFEKEFPVTDVSSEITYNFTAQISEDYSEIFGLSADSEQYAITYVPVPWEIRLLKDDKKVDDTQSLVAGETYTLELFNSLGDAAPDNVQFKNSNGINPDFIVTGTTIIAPTDASEREETFQAVIPFGTGTGGNTKTIASISVKTAQAGTTQYHISWNVNDGTGAGTMPSTYSTDTVIEMPEVTREGYSFAGWYTDSEFKNQEGITETDNGNYWFNADKNQTGDVKFYAKWEVVSGIQEFAEWDSLAAVVNSLESGASGNYKLTGNSTATTAMTVKAGVTVEILGDEKNQIEITADTRYSSLLTVNGTATLSYVSVNASDGFNSKIIDSYGSLSVEDCSFKNSKDTAICINSAASELHAYNITFDSCSANDNPGAIKISSSADADISLTSCRFKNCSNKGETGRNNYGGAVSVYGDASLYACSFTENKDEMVSPANDIFVAKDKTLTLGGESAINSIYIGYESSAYGKILLIMDFTNTNAKEAPNTNKIEIGVYAGSYQVGSDSPQILSFDENVIEKQTLIDIFYSGDADLKFDEKGKMVNSN